MFKYILAENIPDAVQKAMTVLHDEGKFELRNNQDTEEVMSEIQLVMDILNPQDEDFYISKAMPASLEQLISYEDEFILGTSDETGWHYTYHQLYSPYVEKVINELKTNPKSRRAVIALGQGDINFTQDPPCLQLIAFSIVEGKLEITIFFRSNDGVQAFAMNMHAIRCLQALVAQRLGLECSVFHYVGNNFHCYANSQKQLQGYINIFNRKGKLKPYYTKAEYLKAKEKYQNKQ